MTKIPYDLNDLVVMKKAHPCKERTNIFKIVRMGADIKIKCQSCGNVIMLTRANFEKNLKHNLTQEKPD